MELRVRNEKAGALDAWGVVETGDMRPLQVSSLGQGRYMGTACLGGGMVSDMRGFCLFSGIVSWHSRSNIRGEECWVTGCQESLLSGGLSDVTREKDSDECRGRVSFSGFARQANVSRRLPRASVALKFTPTLHRTQTPPS